MTVAHSSAVPTRPRGIIDTKFFIISGVENTSWKGVSITPGDTAFTRMPCGASSRAIDFVYAESAAFDAAYAPAPGPPPVWPAIDTTLTIAPRRRSIIDGATAW